MLARPPRAMSWSVRLALDVRHVPGEDSRARCWTRPTLVHRQGRRLSRVSLSLSHLTSLARSLSRSLSVASSRSLSRSNRTHTHARTKTHVYRLRRRRCGLTSAPSDARVLCTSLCRHPCTARGAAGVGAGEHQHLASIWPRNTSKYRRSMVRGRVGRREANRKGNWEVVGQGSSLPRSDAASADAGSRGGAEARLEPPEDCQGQLQPACEQHPG